MNLATIEQTDKDLFFDIGGLPEGWAYGTLQAIVGPGGILTDGDWVERKDQDPEGDVRLIQLADIGDG
jgi:type I restriction enzyme S subunit